MTVLYGYSGNLTYYLIHLFLIHSFTISFQALNKLSMSIVISVFCFSVLSLHYLLCQYVISISNYKRPAWIAKAFPAAFHVVSVTCLFVQYDMYCAK